MDLKTRQARLVFVDPEDEEIPYWWPAIVVPEEEYELFKETMDNDAGVNVDEHERLVCYFEDGSFSVVPKSGLIPFNPQREPYKSYSIRLKHFQTDAGIRRATDFHNNGTIPKMFKWLILSETGYLDPLEIEEDNSASGGGNEQEDGLIIDSSENQEKQPKPTSTTTKATKSKRGRKPKNPLNPVTTAATLLVASPKPVNPSDSLKIEALLTKTSNESAANTPTTSQDLTSATV